MQLRTFDAQQVLEIAEQLRTRGGEANERSAISRAYYGAFLLARDAANIKDKTAQAHKKTWRHYVERGEKHLARDLAELREARNRADYETEVIVTNEECRLALQASRRIHASLKRISGRTHYREHLGARPGSQRQ